ncbi:hypothetical protein D1007_48961 [Hordeum vulgare]|nr:hypothetical protein D1007_48961 [Hordeum vulgare]
MLVSRAILSPEPDKLTWKWTTNGSYTARSCYQATFHGSIACRSWKLIRKSWAPPKVRFFHCLASQDRCWTTERLARHGLTHHPRCLLCDQEPESMQHLLLACPFTKQTWHGIMSWLRLPTPVPDQDATLHDWWLRARDATPPCSAKRWPP